MTKKRSVSGPEGAAGVITSSRPHEPSPISSKAPSRRFRKPDAHDGRVSDEALMARVQADDPAAFAQLYDRHAVGALRIARWSCSNHTQAEDAVQDAFLSAWRNRATYRPGAGSCRNWLMTIVRNCAVDQSRRNPGYRQVALGDHDSDSDRVGSLHDDLVARREAVALRASVGRLPSAQGEVIHLAYFGGLSQAEIAARLALPLGTVKGRIRLGLTKLRADAQATEPAA